MNLQLHRLSFLFTDSPLQLTTLLHLASKLVSVTTSRQGPRKKHRSLLYELFPWERACIMRKRYPATAAYTCFIRMFPLSSGCCLIFVSRSLPINRSTRHNMKHLSQYSRCLRRDSKLSSLEQKSEMLTAKVNLLSGW
jgi:hypothetical protein